jgi:hypothetical protein
MESQVKQTIVGLGLTALLLGATSVRTAHAGDPAQALGRYVRGVALDATLLASAERGNAVVKLLETGNDLDVAAFGMVRVHASQESILAYFLDVDRSLEPPGGGFGRFGDSPGAPDVVGVAFDETEYRDLRECRPGNCRFKLPASAMQVFVRQVDWSRADAKAQADAILRDRLLRSAVEYRKRGDCEMMTFEDKGTVRARDVFQELAARMSAWLAYPEELKRHLTAYPAERPRGAREALYWSEARLPRLRPTITLDHVVAYAPAGSAGAAFVAKKQLYASHYLDGAFELVALVPGDGGTSLLAVQLFRFDQLSGGPLHIRRRVQEQLQGALRSDLERWRGAAEPRASGKVVPSASAGTGD